MSRKKMLLMTTVAGFVLMATAPFSLGDDADHSADAIVQSQKQLQKDVAELRDEVKAMRTDMRQLLAAMKKMSTTAKRPAAKPRRRPAMDLLGQTPTPQAAPTHGGSEITLGGKSDKVKLAFFYASWCGYCKRTLPGIEKLYEKYKDKDVEIIAINLDDRKGGRARTEKQTLDHYKSLKLTMPLVLDGEKKLGRAYKVSSFPTCFVLGKNGEVEAVHVGGPVGLDKTIAKEFDTLLAGKSLLPNTKGTKTQ